MVSRLSHAMRQIIAAAVAWAGAVAAWLVIDDIPPDRGLTTPIPYVMAIAIGIGLPIQAALEPWHRWRLARLLTIGSVATLPGVAVFWSAFLPHRALFATCLLVGAAWLAVAIFWALARRR